MVTGVDREFSLQSAPLTLRGRQDKFTYDPNGNQITRLVDGVNYTLAYNEENRIETVTDTSASQTWSRSTLLRAFHYDGRKQLPLQSFNKAAQHSRSDSGREQRHARASHSPVQRVNPDGSQLLLLNGGRYYIEIAADSSESTTRYYSIASQRPAMRNNNGSINYLLGDHLGSVSTVVNASGEIISQSRYLPFGELLWEDGASPTDYTYTGQRSLSDIGLMDYNARFYDPMLDRFTSPDELIPNPTISQDLNRFSYVRNNPIRYTDPSGNKILIDDDGMTVQYNSSGNIVIVNGGYTFPSAEKAIANYSLTGNDNYGLSGDNAQFIEKAIQNTEILLAKSMIKHTEEDDEEENIQFQYDQKIMVWTFMFPMVYNRLPSSTYPVNTELNKCIRTENIQNITIQEYSFGSLGNIFIPKNKINQAGRRGWTINSIRETVKNPAFKRNTTDNPLVTNRANGHSVTYYYRPDGHFVVIDDITGQVVQMSKTSDPNWIDEMTNQSIVPFK